MTVALSDMKSNKPFLLRAMHEWIVANNCTPYVLVNASVAGTTVPSQYINAEGRIILDIAPEAVSAFHLSNTAIRFSARFGGVRQEIYLPIAAILAIYAKENGAGMTFNVAEENPWEEKSTQSATIPHKKPSASHHVPFRIVKNDP